MGSDLNIKIHQKAIYIYIKFNLIFMTGVNIYLHHKIYCGYMYIAFLIFMYMYLGIKTGWCMDQMKIVGPVGF